ncbi:hypothetical protein, partial [Streptomyces sp. NPDC055912]|uniref:hypothetical protein n=1 Tax=Streptomyces sp. NPDC055912 TaxID=3345660 RepID=UPI0035D74DD4
MRTPRRTNDAKASAPPSAAARGRRAHAGPPADEPGEPTAEAFPGTGHPASAGHPDAGRVPTGGRTTPGGGRTTAGRVPT